MVNVTTVDLSDSIGCEERFATSNIDFKGTSTVLDFQMGEVSTVLGKKFEWQCNIEIYMWRISTNMISIFMIGP